MVNAPSDLQRAARASVLLRHLDDLPDDTRREARINILVDLLNDLEHPPFVQVKRGTTVLRMMGIAACSQNGLEQALRNWCKRARRTVGAPPEREPV